MNVRPLLTLIMLLQLLSCKKEDALPPVDARLSKIEMFDPTTETTNTLLYKHDNAGKLLEIASSSSNGTGLQLFHYDGSGRLQSNTISNSIDGNQYKYEFELDGNGRISKAKGTPLQPNMFVGDHKYSYDSEGRLSIDSVFTKAGSWDSYVNFEYDNNGNVIAYQQFVNQGTSVYSQGRMTFEYDAMHSPYSKIGQLLYTSSGGGGVSYFYLSKNNPLKASLNNTVITPGGAFNYKYYSNSLLKTSTVNVPDALEITFYYAP